MRWGTTLNQVSMKPMRWYTTEIGKPTPISPFSRLASAPLLIVLSL